MRIPKGDKHFGVRILRGFFVVVVLFLSHSCVNMYHIIINPLQQLPVSNDFLSKMPTLFLSDFFFNLGLFRNTSQLCS